MNECKPIAPPQEENSASLRKRMSYVGDRGAI